SVQGAVSVNSTTVRVTFSEDVADSAADPARYQITQQGAALQVVSARFAGSKHVVELTTAEQNDGSSSLKVSGASDVAGNVLASGRAAFTGRPSPVDTDGDGITDFYERRGYAVTVTQAPQVTEFPLSFPSDTTPSTHEIIADPNAPGAYLVSSPAHNALARFDSATGQTTYFSTGPGTEPHGMAFDGKGRFWVTLEAFDRLVPGDPDTGALLQSRAPPCFTPPPPPTPRPGPPT